jgi:hypothetical protein
MVAVTSHKLVVSGLAVTLVSIVGDTPQLRPQAVGDTSKVLISAGSSTTAVKKAASAGVTG